MQNPYLRLMRFDKPIGIYLLLYPTLWALLLAGAGLKEYIVFILGVVLMRSGGCVINDFADRKIDKLVERTKNRPLTSGEISEKSALILFAFLLISAFILVLFTNSLTIYLSFVAGLLAIIYPFSKRWFAIPQLFLGLAFAMAVPMSFSATFGFIPTSAWLIFLATIIWTIAYDTQYAMSDKIDDLKIGVKSSAIFFGRFDRLAITALQVIFVIFILIIGYEFSLKFWYFLSVFITVLLFVYQWFLIKNNDRQNCFKAFLNNNYVGLVITIGILLEIV
jgi:4-hydroxybenzoate polyprenyltransferase